MSNRDIHQQLSTSNRKTYEKRRTMTPAPSNQPGGGTDGVASCLHSNNLEEASGLNFPSRVPEEICPMAKPMAKKFIVTPRVRRFVTLKEYRRHKADSTQENDRGHFHVWTDSTELTSSSSVQPDRVEGVDEEIPQEIPKINAHTLDESDASFEGSDSDL